MHTRASRVFGLMFNPVELVGRVERQMTDEFRGARRIDDPSKTIFLRKDLLEKKRFVVRFVPPPLAPFESPLKI